MISGGCRGILRMGRPSAPSAAVPGCWMMPGLSRSKVIAARLDGSAVTPEGRRVDPIAYARRKKGKKGVRLTFSRGGAAKRGSGLLFPAAASSLEAPGSGGRLVCEPAGTMICGTARVAREPSAVSHLALSRQPETVRVPYRSIRSRSRLRRVHSLDLFAAPALARPRGLQWTSTAPSRSRL